MTIVKYGILASLLLAPDPDPAAAGGGAPATDVNVLLDKVRKDEQKKAADRIAALEAETGTLRGKLTETEKAAVDAEAARKKAAEDLDSITRAGAGTGSVDLKALVTEVSTKLKKNFEQISAEERQTNETRFAALEKENKQFRLEKVKADAIREAGGTDAVIEQLITGSTPEEIRASVEESKKVRAGILAQAGVTPGSNQNSNANQTGNGQNAAVVPVVPQAGSQGGVGGSASGGSGVLDKVKSMPLKDYKVNRDAILGAARDRYKNSNGNPVIQQR